MNVAGSANSSPEQSSSGTAFVTGSRHYIAFFAILPVIFANMLTWIINPQCQRWL